MTQDEIIEIARFAGIRIDNFGFQGGFIEEFEAFAKLVAAKERETCWNSVGIALFGSDIELTKRVAAAIRARGQA